MDLHDLLMRIEALEADNRRLSERVSELERIQHKADDERGYAEQGAHYSGKHPRSCACNRCLQRQEFWRS